MSATSSYRSIPKPAKASFWFTVCNVVNKGLALLATPILTRIMTTEQYGSFAVFQSWVAVFSIFCSLNLFQSVYSRGLVQFDDQKRRFCSALLGLSTTITALFALLFCIAPSLWSSALAMSPLLISLMFAEIATVSAFEFWAATQRFEYKYKALVLVTVGINVVSLGVGIAAILCTEYKVEARVIADVVAKGIPGIVLAILIFSRGKCFFDKGFWKYALAFNLPLVPHFLSHFVLNQSDRLMIGRMVGDDMAALYSVAYSIAMVMTLVMNAINSSYVPYTYKELAAERIDGIRRTSIPILGLVSVLCVIVMSFGPEVLSVFAGAQYASAARIMPPLTASVFFIFLYSLFSNVEFYYKHTGFISAASVFCAVLNLVLNFVAIPAFGYEAAAWTTLISYIVLSAMHFVAYRGICRREIKRSIYPLRRFLLLTVALLAAMTGMMLLYDFPVIRYAILLAISVGIVLFRKQILKLIRQ